MADIKTTEEIGLELQKRKQNQKNEISDPEVQPVELSESDEIDWELKKRVNEILSSGQWMNVDPKQVIMPEEKGKYAKFQFRRKRQNYEKLKESIKDVGVVDPIVLKTEAGVDGVTRYYILDGHTRFVILLDLLAEDPTTLIPPFLVVECNDADATLIAQKLNEFSENLDDEDRDFAAIRMFEIGGLSQAEIARRLKYSKGMVSMIISAFRDVPAEAREKIESRQWTTKHGIELARLKKDQDEQRRIFDNAKRHRYNAAKMGEMVDNSRARVAFTAEAKKFLREELGDQQKTMTTGDLAKVHEKTVKKLGREKLGFYDGPKKLVYRLGSSEIEPALSHTKEALQELGFSITEGEATIVEPDAEKPKPKMPNDKELMQESYYVSICPYCKGRTTGFIAEEFGFQTEHTYRTGDAIAHDYCYLQAQIEDFQKKLEKTTIYKKLHEDPENFSLEQMNNKSHQMYKDELERRKQKWREENLPDPNKTAKKGTKTGEVVLKAKTVGSDQKASSDLELLKIVRKAQPDLVKEPFFIAYEKHLNKETGYESQAAVKNTLSSSMGTVSRAFLKISNAIEELHE